MAKIALSKKTKDYLNNNQWFEYFVQELSKHPTKHMLLDKIGVPYSHYYNFIKDNKEAQEREEHANLMFEERTLEDIISTVEDYPQLKLKLAERLVTRLNPKANVEVNIDKSQTVNCLGYTEEESHIAGQKILESFKGRQRMLKGANNGDLASEAIIDVTPS
ncbi:MAG: hypothetical protein GY861_10800 [bacterium]|nr:hypothetical protein [bacterium]